MSKLHEFKIYKEHVAKLCSISHKFSGLQLLISHSREFVRRCCFASEYDPKAVHIINTRPSHQRHRTSCGHTVSPIYAFHTVYLMYMETELLLCCVLLWSCHTLQWRHNGCDSVSNHHPHDYLLNCLFRRRSKKTSKLRVTGLCAGNSPHKWPVTRKMFPFDDVIMILLYGFVWLYTNTHKGCFTWVTTQHNKTKQTTSRVLDSVLQVTIHRAVVQEQRFQWVSISKQEFSEPIFQMYTPLCSQIISMHNDHAETIRPSWWRLPCQYPNAFKAAVFGHWQNNSSGGKAVSVRAFLFQ